MSTLIVRFVAIMVLSGLVLAQVETRPPLTLPVTAVQSLSASLDAAASHARHFWRDTPPVNADGSVTAYIEIPKTDLRKWEFDMRANTRAIDRLIPAQVGGYPINYGFVPQTVSYDGDPFDALVLGPPLPGGEPVRGVIVGLMVMEDEKGLDSKVVLAPLGTGERYVLDADERERLADYFGRYKRHEPGKFSRVPGWGTVSDGEAYVRTSHRFFNECREQAARACAVSP